VNVLDAWSVVALLRGEPAGPRVAEAVEAGDALVCSVNLGEAYYILARRGDPERVRQAITRLRARVRSENPDWPLVLSAAELKATRAISYADSFCVATARRHGAPLWTGDPEILALGDIVEVVDLRPTP
jgi:predicted nucleic acid-binding protein